MGKHRHPAALAIGERIRRNLLTRASIRQEHDSASIAKPQSETMTIKSGSHQYSVNLFGASGTGYFISDVRMLQYEQNPAR